jgi:hypothetical protein
LALGHRPNANALTNAQTPEAKIKRQATRDTRGHNSTAGTAAAVQAARDPDVIKRRVATRRATVGFGPKRKFDPSREELDALYQTHSASEIAVIFGVGKTVVSKRIQEHGITLRDGQNGRHRKRKPMSLQQREILSRVASSRLGPLHPNYKGGPVTLICQNPDCPLPERQFVVVYARRNKAKYCSGSCRNRVLSRGRRVPTRWLQHHHPDRDQKVKSVRPCLVS